MSPEDALTGENLINPYVILDNMYSRKAIPLNSATFKNCQKYLINRLQSFKEKFTKLSEKGELFQVHEIVGVDTGVLPNEERYRDPSHSNNIEAFRHEKSRTLLGFLTKEDLLELLPNALKEFD